MSYKIAKIDNETDKILDKCVEEFVKHHPEFRKIKISRNKIIDEIGRFYLRN